MDGSGLIFIVMPIVIPVALFVLVATPVLADAYLTRKSRAAQQGAQPPPGRAAAQGHDLVEAPPPSGRVPAAAPAGVT
jgi:hypothetical protein